MSNSGYFDTVETPAGRLWVTVDESGQLTQVSFTDTGRSFAHDPGRCAAATSQLVEFFRRERTVFDLPLAPRGTAFQLRVWQELLSVSYGQTASYAEIADRVGNPRAVRAVGHANGANPIAVIIPCHRIIGSNGSLTGYGGGLSLKKALLEFERGLPWRDAVAAERMRA